jgi:aryl-alcohol dehydrogenase-like predicted oxidoreductase
MRRITLGTTGIETSALGLGCASFGSRIAPEAAARAMAAALEAGVTWLDLAPVYGGGQAEAIAARVLAGRREETQICTKVGLRLAGGAGGGLRAALMPLARRATAKLGPIGARLRRAAPAANARLPLTPELLRETLEASLRRLGTDRVELYALHAPAVGDLGRDEIQRTLEDLRAAGKARAIGVAGDAAVAAAAVALGAPFDVVQMPSPAPVPGADVDAAAAALAAALAAARAAGRGTITHSVLGDAAETLRRAAAADPALAARLATAAADGAGQGWQAALPGLLLDRAFALNPEGVVLVSMGSPASLAANAARAARLPGADPLAGAVSAV